MLTQCIKMLTAIAEFNRHSFTKMRSDNTNNQFSVVCTHMVEFCRLMHSLIEY